MAQTARNFAALEALLADNTDRDISAVDLRDFLESAMGCYGQLEIEGGSTVEGLTASPAKLDTWLAIGPGRNTTTDIVSPAGDLQLDADGIYAVSFDASFLTSTSDRFTFALRADDVLVTGFSCEVTGITSQRQNASWAGLYSATAGVALSVYGNRDMAGIGDITIEHARLTAHRVG